MDCGLSGRYGTVQRTIREFRDETGDPRGGPGRVLLPSCKSRTGRGPSQRTRTGRGTLGEVKDVLVTLGEVRDGSRDPWGSLGRVGDSPECLGRVEGPSERSGKGR